MFRVPDSDDSMAPSTPDRNRYSFAGPSTTPAGHPPRLPSAGVSSTPAGAPSGGLFGGARPNFAPKPYNPENSLFGSSPPKHHTFEGNGLGHIRTSSGGRPGPQPGRAASAGFGRFLHNPTTAKSTVRQYDGGVDEDAEGEEDEYMDHSADDEPSIAQRPTNMRSSLSRSLASQYSMDEYQSTRMRVRNGAKQQQYDLLALAKGLAPSTSRATIRESDNVVLETERIVESLHALGVDAPMKMGDALGDAAQQLLTLWRTSPSQNLSNASTLAALLLGIHHPNFDISEKRDTSTSRSLIQPGSRTSVPKVLLDWINTERPTDDEFNDVLAAAEGYSNDAAFWDMVLISAMRGQFAMTIKLLKGSNFAVARTAEEDEGEGVLGYQGPKLQYATHAAEEAVILLNRCPGLHGDWDITGHDWTIFREWTYQAKIDLQDFAEGESQSRFSMSQSFGGSHFGLSQSHANFSLSTHSRKVECKVPWSIYESLLKLYDILLGDEEELLTWSESWIEAAIFMTIWWNGKDEDFEDGNLTASRPSVSQAHRSQTADVKAYTRRLAATLATTLDSDEEVFSMKTNDPLEVGIACIMDDNVEGALHILRSFSLLAASAVAEVASAGEWFKRDDIFGELDQSDLLLLSYNQPSRAGLSKDDLLVSYAEQLSSKEEFARQDGSASRVGWELAIEVLGRLDDTALANQRIQRILDELPLSSADQADRVIQLCNTLGMSDQALGIALKYAEQLHASTQNFGDAILYYARAHAAPKIQEVLRALVAHCLIKSVAFPPLSELDTSLEKLVTSPKKTLTELASVDAEAAELLSKELSGYATLRGFYDLRDEELMLNDGEEPKLRPFARKRTAADALIIIISSAASSIRGGLYDPEVETVVPVDVLLSLFGEALIFVNQPKRTLTLRHLYDLLAAVEDLSTAPSMIQMQCEEALRTTLAAAHGNNPPSSLFKSTSNLTTASSQYSLIGSIDLGSMEGVSTESSTIFVKGGGVDDVKRMWDWRKGFPRGAKGEDIIRILRLGIAKELGRAFAEGEVTP